MLTNENKCLDNCNNYIEIANQNSCYIECENLMDNVCYKCPEG